MRTGSYAGPAHKAFWMRPQTTADASSVGPYGSVLKTLSCVNSPRSAASYVVACLFLLWFDTSGSITIDSRVVELLTSRCSNMRLVSDCSMRCTYLLRAPHRRYRRLCALALGANPSSHASAWTSSMIRSPLKQRREAENLMCLGTSLLRGCIHLSFAGARRFCEVLRPLCSLHRDFCAEHQQPH